MGSNYYLGYMSGLYTRELDWNPAAIYPARDYTRLWEMDNYMSSQPYGFHYSYPGGGSYNYVADSFSLPYEVAMRAHGYGGDPTALGMARVQEQCALAAQNTGKNLMASQSSDALQGAQSIGEWKDSEALAERADLKESARKIEEKARALLKRLEDVMKNKDKLPEPEVLAKVKAIKELAIPLKEEAEEIFEQCKEAEKTYNDKKAEDARREAEEAAENAGSDSGSGEDVDTEVQEGDKTLSDAEFKQVYGISRKATIPAISDEDAKDLAAQAMAGAKLYDDDDNRDKFKELFEDIDPVTKKSKINEDNIVEVLLQMKDDDGNESITDYIDGLEDQDADLSGNIPTLRTLYKTLVARCTKLKNDGHLSEDDYNTIIDKLAFIKTDVFSETNPKFPDQKEVADAIRSVCNMISGLGTEAKIRETVDDKDAERKNEGLKNFWKGFASKNPGKSVKSEETALPEGLTYLPNSKKYQYKYDAEHIYKADSYSALNDVILNSHDRKVIAAWDEIVKELEANLN